MHRQRLFTDRHQVYTHPEQMGRFHRLFGQVATIVVEDLGSVVTDQKRVFGRAVAGFAREKGVGSLRSDNPLPEIARFLLERWDLWNNRQPSTEVFVADRLSLIEMALAEVEEDCRQQLDLFNERERSWLANFRAFGVEPDPQAIEKFAEVCDELNQRLSAAHVPFRYSAGLLRPVTDEVMNEVLEAPFWKAVADRPWTSVSDEVREARVRLDGGEFNDAAFHALMGLESALKIASDLCQQTTGNERGAANFVDNLGRDGTLQAWEKDFLKDVFRHRRNPEGHGAGEAEREPVSEAQALWTVETAMSWTKLLIARL